MRERGQCTNEKKHTGLTVKKSNKEVERKYLIEETHVFYHCSSRESKKRIEEEKKMRSERKGLEENRNGKR